MQATSHNSNKAVEILRNESRSRDARIQRQTFADCSEDDLERLRMGVGWSSWDNADDTSFLIDSPGADDNSKTYSLFKCLLKCKHSSILVTSRSNRAALQLVEDGDVIGIHPMTEEHALELLEKKIGKLANRAELKELAAALECMPLALTQATAYIRRGGARSSARQYLEQIRNGELMSPDRSEEIEKITGRQSASTSTTFGANNVGFQVGISYGSISGVATGTRI